MQQSQELYYIQNLKAQEHLKSLYKEARQERMLRKVEKTSLRKKLAIGLVKLAERLEPTLNTPTTAAAYEAPHLTKL